VEIEASEVWKSKEVITKEQKERTLKEIKLGKLFAPSESLKPTGGFEPSTY
jgi:hypothetical protein